MTTQAPPPAEILDGGAALPALGGSATATEPLSRRYDVALLDLDGVVYRGRDAVAGAPQALVAAREAGMRLAFVTNNASRPPSAIVAHLTELGVVAEEDEVVTSAQAAATLAADHLPSGGRVFIVGGEGLRAAIAAAGLPVAERYDSQPAPEMVVQGFSPDLTYEDLAQAALVVAAGATWIATNTDSTVPTARGLQPGNGTLVAAVAAAAGHGPLLVAGKPERALVDEAVRRTGSNHPLMVGDRLDTDIAGAVRAEMDSLLVLTGVSTLADLLAASADARPTYLGADLSVLGEPLRPLSDYALLPVQRETGWRVEPTAAGVRILGRAGAHPLDGVRTLVVAVWAAADSGDPLTSVLVAAETERALIGIGVPAALLHAEDEDAPAATVRSGETDAGE